MCVDSLFCERMMRACGGIVTAIFVVLWNTPRKMAAIFSPAHSRTHRASDSDFYGTQRALTHKSAMEMNKAKQPR